MKKEKSNWAVVRIYKENGNMLITELSKEWSYEVAVGIATETTIDGYELICVIEKNKLLKKNEEEEVEQNL